MSNCKLLAGLSVVFGVWLPASSGLALDIKLTVKEPSGIERVKDPCRTGIPLAPGSLQDLTKLRLVDARDTEVPAQFRIINRRPAGDIEWVCVDFLADVPANGSSIYRLKDDVAAKQPEKSIRVDDSKDAVTVFNGPLKLVIPRGGLAGLGEVWLDRDGNGEFAKEELVSSGGALVIDGMDGKSYSSKTDLAGAVSVTLEEQGPLHVVVRIDGDMKAQAADGKSHSYPSWDGKESRKDGVTLENKDQLLGFTVRINIWKDQSWVRTFVTMRNLKGSTGDWTDAKIQFGQYYAATIAKPGNFLVDAISFDLDLKPAGNLKYRIGGGIEGSESHAGDLDESKGRVTLYQDSSASWMWQAGTGKIWDPLLKKNAEMLAAERAKDGKNDGKEPIAFIGYVPMVFNELLTKRDGGSFMGYRLYKGGKDLAPGSSSGFNDLGAEAGSGVRAPGWLEVDDGKTAVTVGCRWFWQMFPKSLEIRAPGTVSVGLWSRYFPRGHVFEGRIHKTHELVFDFRASGKGLPPEKRFTAFSDRLVAWPGAEHSLASRVYGDFMLPNPEEWPNYEKSALCAVIDAMDPSMVPGKSSSMNIEREKHDNFDVWKFGDSVKEGWHHFGQYLELDVPYCLAVHFARTGDYRFFRESDIAIRQLMDIPAHGGGYGHQKGESSHYYAFGPLLACDVIGEPWLRDAVKHSHEIVNPGPWHARSFAITLWSNWTMFGGFEDGRDRWRKGMDSALAWWTANQKGDALGGFDRISQTFFFGMACDALGRYCESFPDDKVRREKLVAAVKDWMTYVKGLDEQKHKRVCDKTPANAFAYATRFSGDPAYLDFAAQFLVRDDDFPVNYRTGACSAKNWSETMATHRLVQILLHDLDKRKHPDRYKDLP
ncbi:MAG: hypothetical protein C0404_01305 [Verrucomicrobia bacterium]|nr:hypothetical protein [Verrucomicrobiota bacterium]